MYDFSSAEWLPKSLGLFKLINVDGILAYILPHVDEFFEQNGFTYLFWVYKWNRKKRIALFHDYSTDWFTDFDVTEQTLYEHIIYYLEGN